MIEIFNLFIYLCSIVALNESISYYFKAIYLICHCRHCGQLFWVNIIDTLNRATSNEFQLIKLLRIAIIRILITILVSTHLNNIVPVSISEERIYDLSLTLTYDTRWRRKKNRFNCAVHVFFLTFFYFVIFFFFSISILSFHIELCSFIEVSRNR